MFEILRRGAGNQGSRVAKQELKEGCYARSRQLAAAAVVMDLLGGVDSGMPRDGL